MTSRAASADTTTAATKRLFTGLSFLMSSP
jgi:hypothetical protein